MSQAACDQVLRDGDHRRLLKGWSEIFPHLRGPQTEADAKVVMHHARTQNPRIEFKLRAYSHSWLLERALPSGLPDELRPKAQRMYPVVVSAVGISVNTKNEFLKPIVGEVRQSMEYAVLEAEADGKLEDTPHVRKRMLEARKRTYKRLLGR